MAPSAGPEWTGRRASAAAHPPRTGGWAVAGLCSREYGRFGQVRLVDMGASAHLGWVAVVAAASLAVALPAGAQQPATPDPAPSASSAPRPDPAPLKTKPRVVVRAAPRPAAAVTTAAPSAPATTTTATTTAKPRTSAPAHRATPRRATTHHRDPVPRRKRATHVARPRLPQLALTQLSAPARTADSGRARRLAVGALSLLILALASATLLAFTARDERRRVVR